VVITSFSQHALTNCKSLAKFIFFVKSLSKFLNFAASAGSCFLMSSELKTGYREVHKDCTLTQRLIVCSSSVNIVLSAVILSI